jgi:hypothetical protein
MPVVHLSISDKQFGYLTTVANERNRKLKRGETEIRVSDIALPIFTKALEEEMKQHGS